MPVTIDTLAAQRTMEAAGIEPEHAEAIVNAVAHTGDQVATKADIRSLEVEISGVKTDMAAMKVAFTAQMAGLEAKIDSKISALGNRILAAMLAFGGLLYAALRIF